MKLTVRVVLIICFCQIQVWGQEQAKAGIIEKVKTYPAKFVNLCRKNKTDTFFVLLISGVVGDLIWHRSNLTKTCVCRLFKLVFKKQPVQKELPKDQVIQTSSINQGHKEDQSLPDLVGKTVKIMRNNGAVERHNITRRGEAPGEYLSNNNVRFFIDLKPDADSKKRKVYLISEDSQVGSATSIRYGDSYFKSEYGLLDL